jgi:hypothetical protein
MKASSITAALIMIAAWTLTAQPNQHVTLRVKASPEMKPGRAQNIALLFHPKKGIHINLDPSITVTLEKNTVADAVGTIVGSKDAHGYLDSSKPVLVNVTPRADSPKGTHTLKMKVMYFLCSDAEGWCNREEQLLDVPVTVK